MPKQEGTFKIRGKLNGQSYFYTKNGGYQLRNINPNMSERVKTEESFTNTRKCAAEFGACAKSAAEMVGAVANRWRYMLAPDSVAIMTKKIYEEMLLDSVSAWGQRQITTIDQVRLIQNKYNALSKNPFPSDLSLKISSSIVFDNTNIPGRIIVNNDIVTDKSFEDYYISKGANAVQLIFLSFHAGVPKFTDGAYSIASAVTENIPISMTPIARLDGSGGHTLVEASQANSFVVPQNTQNGAGGLLVLLLPMKIVGGTSQYPKFNVLQSLASAAWISLEDYEDN